MLWFKRFPADIGGTVRAAQWANPDILVTPELVEQNIAKPDCRLTAAVLEYTQRTHSRSDQLRQGLQGRAPGRDVEGLLPGKYESMLGKAGVGNNTHVVFYGDMALGAMDDAMVAFWISDTWATRTRPTS